MRARKKVRRRPPWSWNEAEIDPEDSALFLEWAFPEEKPLSSFLLEYGAEKGTYTERRVLNGALRAFTLRDLLNGVTYYVRLTPVATTGDVLSDLSAVNAGAPEAARSRLPCIGARSSPIRS